MQCEKKVWDRSKVLRSALLLSRRTIFSPMDQVRVGDAWTESPQLITPSPPLSSKRPCLVSGGGEGTVTFHFPNFLRNCLNEVLLLVHCCVLQISCMEGTALWQFPGQFVVHMPSCSLSCFVSRVPCLVIGGMREPSIGVGSLRGAREPSRAAAYWTTGRGVPILSFLPNEVLLHMVQ